MLAEIGLSTLDVPEGQLVPAVIPPSVAGASAEELDEQPNVLSFLANNAARRGDLDAAVAFSQRAVASAGDQESAIRLELARFIHRRAVSGDMSPREIRAAIQRAQAVIEERRRWNGPSAEALAFVFDTYIPGDTAAAVPAALPASEGGTAADAESGSVDVAFRGALAAMLTGNAPAYRFLLGKLPDGPHRRYVLAAEVEEKGHPADQRIPAWTRVLEAPGDDPIAAQATAALTRLGHWPQQAEEMHDHGVLPEDAYRLLRAIWEYHAGDPVMGLARLRALADASALAAIELVTLIERRDGYPSFPASVRLDLCEWYTARRGTEGSLAEAAAFAEQGLAIGDHHGLAWNLVKVLCKDGKVTRAREALRRHRPEPVSEDETTLWMQLHLGVPLSPDDARTMIGIAERQPGGDFRDATIGVLIREVIFTSPESGSPFPADVTDAVTRLQERRRAAAVVR